MASSTTLGAEDWRKSSHCASNECLEWAFRKSSHSISGACTEAALQDGVVLVRDSKDPAGPVLEFTPGEWHAFLGGARKGEFDHFG